LSIYRSSEGNRYYRYGKDSRWEILQPDGSWRELQGNTRVVDIAGRLNLLRYHRGGRIWNVEVIKEDAE